MATGRLILRTVVGGLMLGHGLQKLRGSFGGPGLEGTEQAMGAMGLHPARHQALAAALSETAGGGLTAAGLLSPLGPAMIIGTMAVAIHKVHAKNGVWISNGGYEYNLTLIAAAAALAGTGPGPVSVDGLLGHRREGIGWLSGAVAVGVGAAAATVAVSERFKPAGGDAVPTASATAAAPSAAAASATATPGPAATAATAAPGTAAGGVDDTADGSAAAVAAAQGPGQGEPGDRPRPA
jgi:putative oxidoreductase